MAYDIGNSDQPSEIHEAPGVTYTESEHAPGLRLFRCAPYKATLSAKSCAGRWARARDARGEMAWNLAACRSCSIGAAHSGHGLVRYSRHYGAPICARCGRGGFRMIGNRVCVSCANRSYELRKMKNARGHTPVELLQKPLRAVTVLVETDGEVQRLRDRQSSGMVETMIQVLRTRTGNIAFAFAGAGIQPRQTGGRGAEGADPGEAQLAPAGVADQDELDGPAPDPNAGQADAPRRLDIARYRRGLFATTAMAARAPVTAFRRSSAAGQRETRLGLS